jgi:hypothetical protein
MEPTRRHGEVDFDVDGGNAIVDEEDYEAVKKHGGWRVGAGGCITDGNRLTLQRFIAKRMFGTALSSHHLVELRNAPNDCTRASIYVEGLSPDVIFRLDDSIKDAKSKTRKGVRPRKTLYEVHAVIDLYDMVAFRTHSIIKANSVRRSLIEYCRNPSDPDKHLWLAGLPEVQDAVRRHEAWVKQRQDRIHASVDREVVEKEEKLAKMKPTLDIPSHPSRDVQEVTRQLATLLHLDDFSVYPKKRAFYPNDRLKEAQFQAWKESTRTTD